MYNSHRCSRATSTVLSLLMPALAGCRMPSGRPGMPVVLRRTMEEHISTAVATNAAQVRAAALAQLETEAIRSERQRRAAVRAAAEGAAQATRRHVEAEANRRIAEVHARTEAETARARRLLTEELDAVRRDASARIAATQTQASRDLAEAHASAESRLADMASAAAAAEVRVRAEKAALLQSASNALASAQADALRRVAEVREKAARDQTALQAAARQQLDASTREAREKGRIEGERTVQKRMADAAAAAQREAERQAATAINDFRVALTQTRLLGTRHLKEETAKTLEAQHLLEILAKSLKRLGYEVVFHFPYSAMHDIEQFGQAKVVFSVSEAFKSRFAENIDKMSVLDGLHFMNRFYGFTAWIAHDARIIWLGFPASPPPKAAPHTAVELFFNEQKFLSRAGPSATLSASEDPPVPASAADGEDVPPPPVPPHAQSGQGPTNRPPSP